MARREGQILVRAGPPGVRPPDPTTARETRAFTATRGADGVFGSGAAGPADQAEARKVVTIVFADLIGSMSLPNGSTRSPCAG